MPDAINAAWTCPLPLRDYSTIVIGNGGGGHRTATRAAGDVVIVSGTIGDHGMAIMSVRGSQIRHHDRERLRAAE